MDRPPGVDPGRPTTALPCRPVILTRPVKGWALKGWAARIAERGGLRKAKVALARKLAAS